MHLGDASIQSGLQYIGQLFQGQLDDLLGGSWDLNPHLSGYSLKYTEVYMKQVYLLASHVH